MHYAIKMIAFNHISQSQTVDMKNLSENKTPQATCSGDAIGRFYGLGTAWGFLFLNIPPDRQGQPNTVTLTASGGFNSGRE